MVQGGHDFGSSFHPLWEQLNSSSTASSVASSAGQKQCCSLKFHSHGSELFVHANSLEAGRVTLHNACLQAHVMEIQLCKLIRLLPVLKKRPRTFPLLQTRDEVRISSELNFITASSFMNRILSVATYSLVLRPPCRNDPREVLEKS